MTDAYRAEFADLVNGYLDHVGRRVLRSLPATHKLAYHLVRIRAMPQLAELAAWMVEQPVRQVPVVRRWGRLRADLPFRENAPVPIPSRVFRLHWRDLDPYMQVDDIGWDQDRLVVTGRANVPSIDIPRRRNTSKVVVLRPPGPGIRRLPVVLPARSFFHPEATALSEQDRYNYDWSGFRFAVSPRRFRGTGEWQCYMLVRGHGVWRPARVHTPVPGPAERPRPRQVAPGLRFGARWAGLGLNVAAWRLGAVVAAVAWQDAAPRAVRIDVELPGGRPVGAAAPGSPRARPSWSWCATGARRPARSRPPRWSPRREARPDSVPSSRSATWPARPTWWTGSGPAGWPATTGWPGTSTSSGPAVPGSGWRGRTADGRPGTCSAPGRPWPARAATVTL